MPPFSPIGTGEDGLYAAMLTAAWPRTAVAYLPLCVLHDPPSRPPYSSDDLGGADQRLQVNDAIAAFVCAYTPASAWDLQTALDGLGSELISVGRLPSDDFQDALQLAVRRQMLTATAVLRRTLCESGRQPQWWAEDVECRLENLESAAMRTHMSFAEDCTRLSAVGGLQRYIRTFGEIIRAWPAMLNAARQLGLLESLVACTTR
jgi:hypothetical protein